MSNLSRLQAVSSSLDTAIQKVENLPDSGGSSGGGEGGITTVSVDVIATGVTTFYYVGVNGLCSISGVRNTVEMVVPSICYAEIASNSYFLAINTTGDCTLISSLSGSSMSTAFSVTGAGSIIVPSQEKGIQGGN